jgi:hypothetical protein
LYPSPRLFTMDAADEKISAERAEQVENAELGRQSTDSLVRATAKEEAAVIRKLDMRILPLVFVLYSFSVLDRSNLGNAKLAGLEDAIDLSGNNYNLLGTLFYIACKREREPSGSHRGGAG